MLSYRKAKRLLIKHFDGKHPDRLKHIFGVVDMAKYLAKKYDVDVNKAKIAAVMHDYSKYDNVEELEKIFTPDEIDECRHYEFLYHAYGSAYMYKKYIGDDEDIYNAIYNHVFGRPNMSMLEAIIMIADYTEENRKYPSCIEARKMIYEGKFNEAIVYSLEKTMELCLKNHQNPHPRQLEVYNEYLEKVGK